MTKYFPLSLTVHPPCSPESRYASWNTVSPPATTKALPKPRPASMCRRRPSRRQSRISSPSWMPRCSCGTMPRACRPRRWERTCSSRCKQMRGVLDQTAGLYGIVSDAQSSIRGPLRVGCFTTLAAMVTPELCQGFSRAHPQVQVTHVEDHHEGLIERLYKGQIDVAVTYDLEVQGTDITFEPLATLPPHVIVGETSPLAQQRVVDLKGLAEHPMVLLDLPRSREYFFGLFHAQQLEPLVAARSGSPDVVRSLVANGVGYSLVNVRPRMSHSLDGKRVLSLRLAGKHQPMRLGMAWIPVPRPRRVLEAFMQRCRTYISDEHVPGMVAPSHFMWSPQAEPASGDTA
ncbi:LysR substrate-binding domain protein [Bordetella bronchiseptica 00-P-2730]|nr:LysR substrate-binding domain protein [Bordetella bronchiseptica 00-P-2730]